MQAYTPMQAVHIAGMILVKEDGVLEGPRPQDVFLKAMDYKEKLYKSHLEVAESLSQYIDELPEEDKKFFETKSGLYTGRPDIMSNKEVEDNMRIMAALANIEKEKGLLRKLAN